MGLEGKRRSRKLWVKVMGRRKDETERSARRFVEWEVLRLSRIFETFVT